MALGCNNQSTKRRDLNFYRLPLKNEELLTRWLVNLRKPKLPKLLENCYVCSDHFELSCFGRDIKAEVLGKRPKPPLKDDAVPTLFLYNNFKSDAKKRVFSEERKLRKEKEQILKELLGPYYDMKLIPPDKIQEVKINDEDVAEDDKFSIHSLLPISEVACQTDGNPIAEIAPKQSDKPSLATVGTQWSEKDFLPDPQVIKEDHAYCKKTTADATCQVETLSLPITRASKKMKVYKTVRRTPYGKSVTIRLLDNVVKVPLFSKTDK